MSHSSTAIALIGSAFGVGIIAQVSILPISLYYFNQFPLLFWVSNLVLVPLLGFIITIAIAAVGMCFFPTFYLVSGFANRVFDSYRNTVAWIAQWERFFIESIPLDH